MYPSPFFCTGKSFSSSSATSVKSLLTLNDIIQHEVGSAQFLHSFHPSLCFLLRKSHLPLFHHVWNAQYLLKNGIGGVIFEETPTDECQPGIKSIKFCQLLFHVAYTCPCKRGSCFNRGVSPNRAGVLSSNLTTLIHQLLFLPLPYCSFHSIHVHQEWKESAFSLAEVRVVMGSRNLLHSYLLLLTVPDQQLILPVGITFIVSRTMSSYTLCLSPLLTTPFICTLCMAFLLYVLAVCSPPRSLCL